MKNNPSFTILVQLLLLTVIPLVFVAEIVFDEDSNFKNVDFISIFREETPQESKLIENKAVVKEAAYPIAEQVYVSEKDSLSFGF